jgi:glucose dehydrogenase
MRGTPYIIRRRMITALTPELRAATRTPLGTPSLGGPIITTGGVLFIGAAMDHVLRAFEVRTGHELWKGPLPAGARATPMTYRGGTTGKQFVVISVGGSEDRGVGDNVVAFSLP